MRKHLQDIETHHLVQARQRGSLDAYALVATLGAYQQRYLDELFATHGSVAVARLRYEPDLEALQPKPLTIAISTHPHIKVVADAYDLFRRGRKHEIVIGEEFFRPDEETLEGGAHEKIAIGRDLSIEIIDGAYELARICRRGFPGFPLDIDPRGKRPYVTPAAFARIASAYALRHQVRRIEQRGLVATRLALRTKERLNDAYGTLWSTPLETRAEGYAIAGLFPEIDMGRDA